MGRATAPRQLVLALPHAESFARDDFVAGASNRAALSLVDRWPDWPANVVMLVGPEGAGKSHLVSIWAERSGARFLPARSLESTNLPSALSTGALVIEDLSPAADERALFHLLNLAREENSHVLITARSVPAHWSVTIRDLASRLRAIPVVSLAAPDDALLRAVIVKLAADRQIVIDEILAVFLANRVERSFAGARDAVRRLDQEAMRQKRPITRGLAAELFRDRMA